MKNPEFYFTEAISLTRITNGLIQNIRNDLRKTVDDTQERGARYRIDSEAFIDSLE